MEHSKPDMLSGKSGREFIIWKAYQVFREKGYHHTTMADIGEACGLLKGSIYHHFISKEALMEQVLQTAHLYVKDNIFQIAFDHREGSPKERLKKMLEKMEAFYFEEEGGCLMGHMGLEVGNRIEKFTHIIRQFFADWIKAFSHLFKAQYQLKQAKELGRKAVGQIEGAVMLSCIFMDKKYFTETSQQIIAYLV